MTIRRQVTWLTMWLLILALAHAASAEAVRHSGVVTMVDRERGVFTLEEVGPWQVRNGATVTTSRTIAVTPATEFVFVRRIRQAPSGYRDDFTEVKVEPWDLAKGDFVTVECRHERGRSIALRVVLSELEEP